jgi:glycosyltransferase involved in cell wall biosynthesis
MPRLAWFTPLPPTRSGIAAYSAALLPRLAGQYDIDVFTDPAPGPEAGWAGGPPRHWAHDFAWKHFQNPYDLTVYQMGNAACHDFIWPHLARYPGLVVLHDGQLHHARSRALLLAGRPDDYRAEFRYNHPDAPPEVAELVISTLAGSLYYFWPMLRWVARTARLVAVHAQGLAADLRAEFPGVEVLRIRQGMADPTSDDARDAGLALRARHSIPAGGVLFGAFGLITPEKRISAALRGLAQLAAERRDVYLLLAGGAVDHYDAISEARALGVEGRVRLTGYVPDDDLPAYLAAADVCLCLRWPTSRETSHPWIRAVAAAKPTIVTDLAHASEMPSLEPGTWKVLAPAFPEAGISADPVSVSVDVLDEEASLTLAMRRLASDAALRENLGRAGRACWQASHTMDCTVADYRRVIARAIERPAPRVSGLPAHLLRDGTEETRRLAAQMGVAIDFLERRDNAGGPAPGRACS